MLNLGDVKLRHRVSFCWEMLIGDVIALNWGTTEGEFWIELEDGNLKWEGPRLICLLADEEILAFLVDGGSNGGSGFRVDDGVTAKDFGVLTEELIRFEMLIFLLLLFKVVGIQFIGDEVKIFELIWSGTEV